MMLVNWHPLVECMKIEISLIKTIDAKLVYHIRM